MKIFAFFVFLTSFSYAAEFGTFMLVKGKVLIINEKSQTSDAKVSSKIYVGETVVTENDSRAKIIMSDRNVLNILPNTKMKIEKYTSGGRKEVQLNLIEGKVRSNVGEKYDNKSSKFEIRTATAVAGVRGTEFITSYNPATKVTEVLTIHGSVIFKPAVADMDASELEVVVNKQEKSEQSGKEKPTKPVKVPRSEFDAIEKESNVASDKKSRRGNTVADSSKGTDGAPDEVREGPTAGSPGFGGVPIKPPEAETRLPDKTGVKVIISPPPSP